MLITNDTGASEFFMGRICMCTVRKMPCGECFRAELTPREPPPRQICPWIYRSVSCRFPTFCVLTVQYVWLNITLSIFVFCNIPARDESRCVLSDHRVQQEPLRLVQGWVFLRDHLTRRHGRFDRQERAQKTAETDPATEERQDHPGANARAVLFRGVPIRAGRLAVSPTDASVRVLGGRDAFPAARRHEPGRGLLPDRESTHQQQVCAKGGARVASLHSIPLLVKVTLTRRNKTSPTPILASLI